MPYDRFKTVLRSVCTLKIVFAVATTGLAIDTIAQPAQACSNERTSYASNGQVITHYEWRCTNWKERLYTNTTHCPSDISFADCRQEQKRVSVNNWNAVQQQGGWHRPSAWRFASQNFQQPDFDRVRVRVRNGGGGGGNLSALPRPASEAAALHRRRQMIRWNNTAGTPSRIITGSPIGTTYRYDELAPRTNRYVPAVRVYPAVNRSIASQTHRPTYRTRQPVVVRPAVQAHRPTSQAELEALINQGRLRRVN